MKRPKVEVVHQDPQVSEHMFQTEMPEPEVPAKRQMKREAVEDSNRSTPSPELEPATTLLPQVKLEHQIRVQQFDYELYFHQQQQLQIQQQQLDIIDDHCYASVSNSATGPGQELDSSLQNNHHEGCQADFDELQRIVDGSSTDQQVNPLSTTDQQLNPLSTADQQVNPLSDNPALSPSSENDYPFVVSTEVEIESHLDFSKAFRKKIVKPKQEVNYLFIQHNYWPFWPSGLELLSKLLPCSGEL